MPARSSRTIAAGVLGTALALTACTGPRSPPPVPGDPYRALGTEEQVLAAAARQRALDELPARTSMEWEAPQGTARGRVTPLRSFLTDTGLYCREFMEEVNSAGTADRFTDVRCRTSAGRWLRPTE